MPSSEPGAFPIESENPVVALCAAGMAVEGSPNEEGYRDFVAFGIDRLARTLTERLPSAIHEPPQTGHRDSPSRP